MSAHQSSSPLQNAELDERLLANPDDLSAYLVYSDWLSERGDPRGELIAIQAKLEELRPSPKPLSSRASKRTPSLELDYERKNLSEPPAKHAPSPALTELEAREAKLIADNASRWLGPLAARAQSKDLSFAWRLGFLDAVRFGPPLSDYATSDSDFAEAYRQLMTEVPHVRFMREVTIGGKDADDWPAEWQDVIDVMVELGLPRGCQSLVFDCGGYWDISSTHLGTIEKLYPQLESLRKLRIRMGGMTFGSSMNLPKLESLQIETGGLRAENIKSIVDSPWPRLRQLMLCIGESNNDYGCDVELEHLTPIFEAQGLSNVKHLGLRNTNLADDLPEQLASSKILPQLETLDLSLGTFGDAGARAILERADSFKHLKRINLTHHYVSPALQLELAKLGPDFDFSDAGEAEDDDRYVQISE